MDKNKNEIGYEFFSLHQERSQEREIYLRVDKKITREDLCNAFDTDRDNVFSYMEIWKTIGETDNYDITELPYVNPEYHMWWNTCDISLNEDGTIMVKLPIPSL